MFSANFLGKDSYIDYNLKIKNRPPIPKPQRRVTYFTIDGRNGTLTEDQGTYDDIVIPVEFMLINQTNIPQQARLIKAWIDSGQGPLIFSDEADKKYIAQCVNSFDLIQELINYGEFTAAFNCRPFSYAVEDDLIVNYGNQVTRAGTAFDPLKSYNYSGGATFTNNAAVSNAPNGPVIFNNNGTEDSEPIITVYGQGNITLTINANSFTVNNIVDYVVVDSVLQDTYKDTQPLNESTTGDYPILLPGNNVISWTGTVSRIEIQCNSAWI